MKASTAFPASRFERPLFCATFWMNSCFVKAFLLVGDADRQTLAQDPNNAIGYRSTMRLAARLSDLATRATAAGAGRPRGRARRRRPPRGRRRRPRSRRAGPASRSASTASSAAPPEVTTSSTRQTRSPGSNGPSIRLPVPYAFASLADDHERQARSRARPRPRAARRRAPARRAAPRRARARARRRRSPRRAAGAGRAACGSGTCRGSSELRLPERSTKSPSSSAASRIASARSPVAAPPHQSGARTSRASASMRSASGEPSGSDDHRAVVGVELDALEPARGAAAVEHRAGERARPPSISAGERAYAEVSAFFGAARACALLGGAASSIGAEAVLEVVEDEADRRVGPRRRDDQAAVAAHGEDAARRASRPRAGSGRAGRVPSASCVGLLEQPRGPPRRTAPRGRVVDRRGQDRAVLVDDRHLGDLRGDLGQVGERLGGIHGR